MDVLDVIVVGGGMAGVSIGYELAGRASVRGDSTAERSHRRP